MTKKPYAGQKLYVDPNSNAARQATRWQEEGHKPTADIATMHKLAMVPTALWLGDWTKDVEAAVRSRLDADRVKLHTLVVYNIPHRDRGYYSEQKDAVDRAGYVDFINTIAEGLSHRADAHSGRPAAIVIIEPDALALMDDLTLLEQAERYELLHHAVRTLSKAGARVYIDAGGSNWVPAVVMAPRLAAANRSHSAEGFALNVAHFETTADSFVYADQLRKILGPIHYVIDTGRNGAGPYEAQPDDRPDIEWCNPPGRAIGDKPTLSAARPGCDALLWVKPPGESDGPDAGAWRPDWALEMARHPRARK